MVVVSLLLLLPPVPIYSTPLTQERSKTSDSDILIHWNAQQVRTLLSFNRSSRVTCTNELI